MPKVAEQFMKVRELLEHMDSQVPKDAKNRRRAPRLPVRMPMTITLLGSHGPTSVEIYSRNFSLSGFGFVSKRLFRSDERIAMLLVFPNQTSKQIFARITFGRYIRAGLYEMGSEFLDSVSNPKNPEAFPRHWQHS
jgi:hypothetical protein